MPDRIIPDKIDNIVARLNSEINAVLELDRRINLPATSILVRANGSNIILEGRVEDIPSKRIVTNVARQLVGDDYTIEDRLRVSVRMTGDAPLRDKATRILLEEPIFQECTIISTGKGTRSRLLRDKGPQAKGWIRVAVKEGVVTLTGHVNSLTHRRMAEALIWWIEGCQRVDNLLRVVPAEEDSDEELTDAIRMVLEKDPLIHAGQIRVAIAAGVVELLGQLASDEERKIAVRDVWSIPDVWDVYNRIHVGHGLA